MPLTTIYPDPLTGTVGKRPSGAPYYRRDSRFGDPERRRLDRNQVARILFLAEALDRRTRAKGQHGGILKGKGLDVLRALLRRFYCYATGECYPAYEEIAEAAGCCRATVATKIRALAAAGILEVTRRKIVQRFSWGRVRFDVAVQTSNSYVFNVPLPDRRDYGDLALPLLRKSRQNGDSEAESKFRAETTHQIKNTGASAPAQSFLGKDCPTD